MLLSFVDFIDKAMSRDRGVINADRSLLVFNTADTRVFFGKFILFTLIVSVCEIALIRQIFSGDLGVLFAVFVLFCWGIRTLDF